MFRLGPNSRCLKNGKRGFSLVELIVVILIIAILAVAVFAGGSAAIKKAQKARTISDLHNFQIAVAMTMNENPQIANIEAATKKDKLSAIMDALNANLPADYKVTLQTAAMDGNISMDAQTDDNADFIICKSEKTDAWDNPYFVILDSAQRGGSAASEFYMTTVSAGPNAILKITSQIDKDDVFDLSSYADGNVKSEVYDVSDAAPTIVGGTAAATSYIAPAYAPVNNGVTTVANANAGGGSCDDDITLYVGSIEYASISLGSEYPLATYTIRTYDDLASYTGSFGDLWLDVDKNGKLSFSEALYVIACGVSYAVSGEDSIVAWFDGQGGEEGFVSSYSSFYADFNTACAGYINGSTLIYKRANNSLVLPNRDTYFDPYDIMISFPSPEIGLSYIGEPSDLIVYYPVEVDNFGNITNSNCVIDNIGNYDGLYLDSISYFYGATVKDENGSTYNIGETPVLDAISSGAIILGDLSQGVFTIQNP